MKTPTSPIKIDKEDILDLNGSVVDAATGSQEISDCNKYLQLNGSAINDVLAPVDVILYDAFKPLHNKAKSLHKTGHYVTGLKIHFGVDNSTNKICVFYQPVCLDNGKDIGLKLRQYTVVGGDWYSYDSGKNMFVSKNHNEALPFLNNHKEKINILHTDSADEYSRFIPSVDVEAVIFPFQKITSFISENPLATHIGLYNAIRKEENSVKHTLLLKAINGSSQIASRSAAPEAASSYGNLANLCPPNGESVTCPTGE